MICLLIKRGEDPPPCPRHALVQGTPPVRTTLFSHRAVPWTRVPASLIGNCIHIPYNVFSSGILHYERCPALPRQPLSKTLAGHGPIKGQVRIVARPEAGTPASPDSVIRHSALCRICNDGQCCLGQSPRSWGSTFLPLGCRQCKNHTGAALGS